MTTSETGRTGSRLGLQGVRKRCVLDPLRYANKRFQAHRVSTSFLVVVSRELEGLGLEAAGVREGKDG